MDLFNSIRQPGNDYVTMQDFEKYCKKEHLDQKIGTQVWSYLLEKYDLNKDDKFDFNEFQTLIKNHPHIFIGAPSVWTDWDFVLEFICLINYILICLTYYTHFFHKYEYVFDFIEYHTYAIQAILTLKLIYESSQREYNHKVLENLVLSQQNSK